jgi:hypothetical protein
MDRINSRIAQAYGYAVCFIAVIVILVSIKSVVDAAINLSDPIRAENGGYGRTGWPLSSFEIYKLEARREPGPRGTAPMPVGATQSPRADTLSDADLRKMYDAEREQVIGNVKFRSTRTLIGSLLLIAVAAVLFIIHWRWLKQRDALPDTP